MWLIGGVLPWWSPVSDALGMRVGLPPFPPTRYAPLRPASPMKVTFTQ